jgi:hypothetical protein
VTSRDYNLVIVWSQTSASPIRNISGGSVSSLSMFVTDSDDIYVDTRYTSNRVDKWISNATSFVPAMFICKSCYGLFIDTANYLYCSMMDLHQVVSTSVDTRVNLWNTVAGTGVPGTTSMMLQNPHGIFVNVNFDLYVADCSNNRIQKFRQGKLNASTVVGSMVPGTIALYCPRSIVIDADGFLFITDSLNHRIIGSGPYGFRCIFACAGYGSAASRLYNPMAISFDSDGNIFVADSTNNRIQKISFIPSSCSEYHRTSSWLAQCELRYQPFSHVHCLMKDI